MMLLLMSGKISLVFDHYKRTIHQVLEIFPVGKVEVGRRRNDLLVIPEKQVLLFGEGFSKKKNAIGFISHRLEFPERFGIQHQLAHKWCIPEQVPCIGFLLIDVALQAFLLVIDGRLYLEVIGRHKGEQE